MALSASLQRELIRLQCHEGLDLAGAAYEWNHARQILAIRLAEAKGKQRVEGLSGDLYSREFLVERPLLKALSPHAEGPPVLLVDELDRAGRTFRGLPARIPCRFPHEYSGTWRTQGCRGRPWSSSRRTARAEVHDALKRRCLYCWVEYPTQAAEEKILAARVPNLPKVLRAKVAGFVQALRKEGLFKAPGVSETLDWAEALMAMGAREVDGQAVSDTLGALLKYQEDLETVDDGMVERLLAAPA